MTIETKHAPGATIWVMNNNIPVNGCIESIHIDISFGDKINIVYSIRGINGYSKDIDLFKTKEALLQSL